MDIVKFFVLLLSVAGCAWSHHHHGYYPEHGKENSRVDFVERKATFESEKETTSPSESLEINEKRPEEPSDEKGSMPFSERRLEKMLEKAILKIITGDLSTADMLLLKSLNYSREEVLAIRKRELDRQKDEELRKLAKSNGRNFYSEDLYGRRAKHWRHNSMEFHSSSRNDPDVEEARGERKKSRHRASYDKDFDFDAYNRQAVIDYENLASDLEQSRSEPVDLDYEDESREQSRELHRNFDRAMAPHVVFKIRYDDSEFDSSSGSDERSRFVGRDAAKDLKHRANSTLRHTTAKNVASSFHASSLPSSSSSSSSASSSVAGHTPLPVVYQLGNFRGVGPYYSEASFNAVEPTETSSATVAGITSDANSGATTELDGEPAVNEAAEKRISEYEGLEWVEDDVYRVIPAFADSLDNVDETAEDYEEQSSLPEVPPDSENDTIEYQNDTPDSARRPTISVNASIENASPLNLSTYQQLALAHRRE